MRVFSNLAVSLDGKIADPRVPHKMLGSPEDRRRMDVIRQMADVVVFGATTLKSHPRAVKLRKKNKNKKPLANAVITASGNLDPAWPFWEDPEVIRFVFTTAEGEKKALESSQDRAFVVTVGEKELDPKKILLRLKESCFSNVLVEGGGQCMSLFLREKLIQELYVTITPWLLGGKDSPTLVDGPESLPEWIRLKKIKAEWKSEDLFTHFKVSGARRV